MDEADALGDRITIMSSGWALKLLGKKGPRLGSGKETLNMNILVGSSKLKDYLFCFRPVSCGEEGNTNKIAPSENITLDIPQSEIAATTFLSPAEHRAKKWAKFSGHFRALFSVQNDPP